MKTEYLTLELKKDIFADLEISKEIAIEYGIPVLIEKINNPNRLDSYKSTYINGFFIEVNCPKVLKNWNIVLAITNEKLKNQNGIFGLKFVNEYCKIEECNKVSNI